MSVSGESQEHHVMRERAKARPGWQMEHEPAAACVTFRSHILPYGLADSRCRPRPSTPEFGIDPASLRHQLVR